MKIRLLSASFLAASCAATSLWAHHGDAGRFEDATTTIVGTVVAFQFVNPHSVIIFSVADESGAQTTWQAELGGLQGLVRSYGWDRNTFEPGDRISVTGRVVKSGAPHINLTERARIVMLSTCEEIYVSRSEPEEPIDCTD
jgi:hypothetical protein